MKYLYAAYAATWIIHGSYIALLVLKSRRLNRELENFKQKGG